MSTILALSGWRRSGKDTVGNYLSDKYNFQKLSFAGALKDSAADLFSIDRNIFDNDELKDKPLQHLLLEPKIDATSETLVDMLAGEFKEVENVKYYTPRTLCILLGAVGRVVSNDFWVKKAISNLDPNMNYVITDLRFKNEIEALQKAVDSHKIHSVRIDRFETIDSTNPSERDLDSYSFDFRLDNRSSIDNLHSQVDSLLKEIL